MELMNVSGVLNHNYIGAVVYTTVIEEDFDELKIEFSFDKHKLEEKSADLETALINSYKENLAEVPGEEKLNQLIGDMKTEINLSLYMNDEFIGSAHRDEAVKKIYISKTAASPGFLTYSGKRGTLKIILNVISIINDQTPYQLFVEVN